MFRKVEAGPIVDGLPVQKFMTAAGDGTGAYNLNGNYAAAPTDFYYQNNSYKYDIYSLLIVISDATTFNQTDYGGIVGGVTNGVKLFVKPSGASEIPLLGGIPIKKNYEWLSLTPITHLTSFAGTPQTLMVNFNLLVDYGKPINMALGDRFIIRLNDDFTGLVSHSFGIRGIKFT